MRKLMIGLVGAAMATYVTGCATSYPIGSFYTELKLPQGVTSNVGSSKIGRSKCTSILSLVATGDASIQAAAKSAGITKIHHVDWEAKNILGVIGEYECVVYGE